MQTRNPAEIAIFNALVDHRIVHTRVYRTQWTDEAKMTPEYLLSLPRRPDPRLRVIEGDGDVREIDWRRDRIKLEADMRRAGQVWLALRYFPVWQLSIDGRPSDAISAEPRSGLTVIRLPAGKHTLLLRADPAPEMGRLYMAAKTVSLAAAALLFLLLRKKRRILRIGSHDFAHR